MSESIIYIESWTYETETGAAPDYTDDTPVATVYDDESLWKTIQMPANSPREDDIDQ